MQKDDFSQGLKISLLLIMPTLVLFLIQLIFTECLLIFHEMYD